MYLNYVQFLFVNSVIPVCFGRDMPALWRVAEEDCFSLKAETLGERYRVGDLPSPSSLPKCPTKLELGQTKARGQECNPGLLQGY